MQRQRTTPAKKLECLVSISGCHHTIQWRQRKDPQKMPRTSPSLGFDVNHRITRIRFLVPDVLHGGHESFHKSTHEIDRSQQPDNLDHDNIMPSSREPVQQTSERESCGRDCDLNNYEGSTGFGLSNLTTNNFSLVTLPFWSNSSG